MGIYKYGRTVGEFVRRFRHDEGLSQNELGRRLGVSGQFVSNTEREVNKNNLGFCKRLMAILPEDRRLFLADLVAEERASTVSEALMRVRPRRKRK